MSELENFKTLPCFYTGRVMRKGKIKYRYQNVKDPEDAFVITKKVRAPFGYNIGAILDLRVDDETVLLNARVCHNTAISDNTIETIKQWKIDDKAVMTAKYAASKDYGDYEEHLAVFRRAYKEGSWQNREALLAFVIREITK